MGAIKVFTAFSGYDSQCLALERLKRDYSDFNYNLVGWSEIDKYAIQAHNALFPQWADRNYGDISKIDWSQVPDFDFFTYSSPCQDFSNAGLQKGGEEGSGTRSSLLWECRKAIVAKRPKYLMLENVKALVSKKFLPLLNKWIKDLEDYGYYNTWQVLNAKDYGVPQNRERVFLISIRRDLLDPSPIYHFPKPFPLELRLKDVLEENVNEKYYLSDKMIKYINSNGGREGGFIGGKNITNREGFAACLNARYAKMGRQDNYIRTELNDDDVFIVEIKCLKFTAPNSGSGTGYSQYFTIEIEYSNGTTQLMELHTWYQPISVIISDFLLGLKYCPDMESQKIDVLRLFKALREKDLSIWDHYEAFVQHSQEGWITER